MLSVIIVNWNTRALLQACLDSLAPSIQHDCTEVLVVDNASSDNSVQMVKQHFPWVRLLVNQENVGFGAANNIAYRQARGEVVLFLNQDTLVPAGTLAALLEILADHPQVGALGPRVLNPDGTPQASIHPRPTLLREAWRLLHLDRLYPVSQYPAGWLTGNRERLVDVLMGCCMLVRRQILEQVGLFDEQFFMYSEEVDLCERIRRAGWGILYTPRACITHFGGQSTSQAADAMFLELYRNKVKFFRKHYGAGSATWYKRLLWLVSLPRAALAWLAPLLPASGAERSRTISHQYRCLLRVLEGF